MTEFVNPFAGAPVQIQLKSKIIYKGSQVEDIPKMCKPGQVGVIITNWRPGAGITLFDGTFIPWSNVLCISPFASFPGDVLHD